MTTKQNSKSVSPVVEGTVLSRDAVLFVRPKTATERKAVSAANTERIRETVASIEQGTGRLLSFLVLALVLNPEGAGTDTDALTAMRTGEHAVAGLTAKQVSYARAAYILVSTAGIGSTEDPRWNVALQAAHRMGIGADRITKALDARKTANAKRGLAERILSDAAKVKGTEREKMLKAAFPGTRNSDGPATGSKAFRAASDALTKVEEALKVKEADGGMTAAERETVGVILSRLAERSGQSA